MALLFSLILSCCWTGNAVAQPTSLNPQKQLVKSHPNVVSSSVVMKPQPTIVDNVATTRISLSINNGTLMDIIPAIANAISPKSVTIEVRHNMAFHVSLTVSNMPVEDVLRGLAGFAHCNLYILPDRFLICPKAQLKPSEAALISSEGPSPGLVIGVSSKH
jgi:hypothetical protein